MTSDVAMDANAPIDADAPLVTRRALVVGNLDLLFVVAAVVPALALDAPEPGFCSVRVDGSCSAWSPRSTGG